MQGYEKDRKEEIKITDFEDLLGCFVLNDGHVFCVRYYDDKWFVIDSMNGNQPEVTQSYFQNKKVTFIFVWRNLNILSKLSLED